jgi:hypothetical protein
VGAIVRLSDSVPIGLPLGVVGFGPEEHAATARHASAASNDRRVPFMPVTIETAV